MFIIQPFTPFGKRLIYSQRFLPALPLQSLGRSCGLTAFQAPSAASGAAQPPRPQGAGFRRKREPRGAWARQKLVRTPRVKPELFYKLTVFAVQYGGRGTCPPTGCRGGAPASIHAKTSFSRRARRAGGAAAAPAGRGLPKEAQAARSLGKAKIRYKRHAFKRGFGGRVPRRDAGAEPLRKDVSPDGVAGAEPLRSSNAYKVSSPPASNLL